MYTIETKNGETVIHSECGRDYTLTQTTGIRSGKAFDKIIIFDSTPNKDGFWTGIVDYFCGSSFYTDDQLLSDAKPYIEKYEDLHKYDDGFRQRVIGKPEVFYTGGGIWVSAMYIDEYHYIATDNCEYEDGFCIYDRMEEDGEFNDMFPLMNVIDDAQKDNFTEQERVYYNILRAALEKEMR